jgi:predicted  nucleic acid-binding Zn-ribbon protein
MTTATQLNFDALMDDGEVLTVHADGVFILQLPNGVHLAAPER